jgi:hypothetical protein
MHPFDANIVPTVVQMNLPACKVVIFSIGLILELLLAMDGTPIQGFLLLSKSTERHDVQKDD